MCVILSFAFSWDWFRAYFLLPTQFLALISYLYRTCYIKPPSQSVIIHRQLANIWLKKQKKIKEDQPGDWIPILLFLGVKKV